MVFSSMLFVFLFLTLNLLSQIYFQDVKKKNIAMLVFSLVFYSWSGPRYLILLAGMPATGKTTLANAIAARLGLGRADLHRLIDDAEDPVLNPETPRGNTP